MPIQTHCSHNNQYDSEFYAHNDNLSFTTDTDLQMSFDENEYEYDENNSYDGEYDMDVLEEAAYQLKHKVIGWSVDNSVSDLEDVYHWNKLEIIDFLDALYEEEEKRFQYNYNENGICPAEQLNAIDRLLEKYETQAEHQYNQCRDRTQYIHHQNNQDLRVFNPTSNSNSINNCYIPTRHTPLGGSPIPNENDQPVDLLAPIRPVRQITTSPLQNHRTHDQRQVLRNIEPNV